MSACCPEFPNCNCKVRTLEPPTDEELQAAMTRRMKADLKEKLLLQCQLKHRKNTRQQYIIGTRIMRKGMDELGVEQVAERCEAAAVLLFSAYISRNEDDKTKLSMIELAKEFNKGQIAND